jgi:hypothetical protein
VIVAVVQELLTVHNNNETVKGKGGSREGIAPNPRTQGRQLILILRKTKKSKYIQRQGIEKNEEKDSKV